MKESDVKREIERMTENRKHYSNTNNPVDFPKTVKVDMNERIEHCLYQSGLTAQGCWDELDEYAKQGIEKFAELIINECADIATINQYEAYTVGHYVKKHFGVEK